MKKRKKNNSKVLLLTMSISIGALIVLQLLYFIK